MCSSAPISATGFHNQSHIKLIFQCFTISKCYQDPQIMGSLSAFNNL